MISLILCVCFAEIASIAASMYFSALLPGFQAEWGLTNTAAGWISGIYFGGYAAHCWELFGFRSWMVAFIFFQFASYATDEYSNESSKSCNPDSFSRGTGKYPGQRRRPVLGSTTVYHSHYVGFRYCGQYHRILLSENYALMPISRSGPIQLQPTTGLWTGKNRKLAVKCCGS